MKRLYIVEIKRIALVTSLAEVWIETSKLETGLPFKNVTSLAEVWIETNKVRINIAHGVVTSLAEVWIETEVSNEKQKKLLSHFPCGSVD